MKTAFFSRFAKASGFATLLMIASAFSAFANPVDVNKRIMQQFQNQFKNVTNVTWKSTPQFTSACFILDGVKTSVFYDGSNSLLCVTKEIFKEDLPKEAIKTIDSKYSKFTLKSAIEYIDADGNSSYYVQLQKGSKEQILKSDELGSLSEFEPQ